MARKKKSDGWQHSEGKSILIAKLRDGEIPMCGGDVAAIYAMHPAFGGPDNPEYAVYEPARKSVTEGIQRCGFEAAALESDREINPPSLFNQRVCPVFTEI